MERFTLLIISTIFLLSCNQAKNKNEEKPVATTVKTETVSIKNTVTLAVVPKAFKLSSIPSTVKVEMTNNTKDTITTGLYYHIEHYANNQWLKVSPDLFFHDLGFSLPEEDFKDFEVKLLKDQIEYEVGKYRIVKYYLKPDYHKTEKQLNVFAEFFIV